MPASTSWPPNHCLVDSPKVRSHPFLRQLCCRPSVEVPFNIPAYFPLIRQYDVRLPLRRVLQIFSIVYMPSYHSRRRVYRNDNLFHVLSRCDRASTRKFLNSACLRFNSCCDSAREFLTWSKFLHLGKGGSHDYSRRNEGKERNRRREDANSDTHFIPSIAQNPHNLQCEPHRSQKHAQMITPFEELNGR